MDTAQITQAMAGVNSVVHCAVGSSDIIVQGTRNMLDAALRVGVENFIHLSTAEIYGDVTGRIDEAFPYQYRGDEYADSKIEAEELCWTFYAKGLPVTVIRPSIVYGPFSKVWTVKLAERLQAGRGGILRDYGEGICNLVYIDDLVSSILLAIRHQNAVGEAFNINGPDIITWNQYFQKFNTAMGLAKLDEIQPASSKLNSILMEGIGSSAGYLLDHFRNPIMMISQRSDVTRRLMRKTKKTVQTTPSLAELKLYSRNALYVTSKARDTLGYNPKFDINTGLQMTVSWLNHHGLLWHNASR
jgi:nucleoside-diphosphate-sugar epimerase